MNPTEFTPIAGLAGGTLIGLSAVVLMLTAGRIAGASSIFRGLLTFDFGEDFGWRILFMIGLLIGTAISGLFFFDPNSITFPSGTPMTIISGLIVGIGVTLGNGCTSGHGICGLSRFSKRSLAATCTFMAVAIVTVFVTRHVIGG
jgi:uncharacterized protein